MTSLNRRTALGMLAASAGTFGITPAYAQEKRKVAFLLNGTPGKVGWNYEHARGIEMAQQAHGDRVQIDSFYGVPEWGKGDAEKMRELVNDGYDMIFACSFGYMKSAVATAFTAPNTKFEHCGGYIRAANMATYSARWYEGRVPQGLIAGAVTKTNRIGYLASFPIAQILRGINAAYVAAKSVNPAVEFDIVWLNSWFNPEKEEEVARALADRGADVLLQHTNSTKPTEVAEELGINSFGQGSDMTEFGPNAVLSSTINNWGPYYVRRIAEMLDGTWQTEDTWGGLSQDMITIGKLSEKIPNRTFLQANSAVERIREGKTHPLVGPLKKQDGSGWLAPGEQASDHDLLTMNFYVEGITSIIPSKS